MLKLLLLHVLFCFCQQDEVFAAGPVCKETFGGKNGVIKSVGFPVEYPSESECLWLIAVESGYYVSLEFGVFDIEGEGKLCIDIVEIKDGEDTNAPLIGGYCNIRPPPPVITSSSNYLRLWFSSDKTANLKGFNASYKAVKDPGCGPTDLVGGQGSLESPRFPDFYPNNYNCEWYITVPSGFYVRLNFLGYAMSCEDSLEVWDWKQDIMTSHGKYCLTLPQLIVSKSNKMKIKFTSDQSLRFRGFNASFTTSLTPGCGGDLTGESGTLLSPNHPFVYPAYSNCVWRLRVPENRYISLRFKQFLIADQSMKCFYDAVEVREGYSRDSPLIGRFCNLNLPPIITVEGRELFIQFATGPGKTQGFFAASFLAHKSGCTESLGLAADDNRITNNQLSASSYNYVTLVNNKIIYFLPQYGRLKSSLAWCSKPPKDGSVGEYFQITFANNMDITAVATQGHFYRPIGHTAYVEKFAMTYRYNGSNYWISYVDKTVYVTGQSYKVMDANMDTDTIVRTDLTPTILAKDIRIYPIKWYSNLDSPTICLRAEVYGCKYSLGCGRTFSAITAGIITSRGSTAQGSRCTWLSIPSPIKEVYKHYALVLTFSYFDIPCEGKLSVTNRMTSEQEEYCGKDQPGVLITRPSDQVKIDKITSSSSSAAGFDVKHRIEYLGSCGFLLDVGNEMGNLTSPKYPDSYGHYRNCTWILMAKKNHKIQLGFQKFLLQPKNSTNCLDFLEIKDGPLDSSEVINRYCGNGIPDSVTSSGRYLRVSFVSDGLIDEAGFLASYTEIKPLDAGVVGARGGGLSEGGIAFIVIFFIILILIIVDFACCHFNKCGITHMLTEREKNAEQYHRAASDENKNISKKGTAEAETETTDLPIVATDANVYVNVEDQTSEAQAQGARARYDGYEDVTLEVPEAEDRTDAEPATEAEDRTDVEPATEAEAEPEPGHEAELEDVKIEEAPKEEKRVSFKDEIEVATVSEEYPDEYESAPSTPNLSIRDTKPEDETSEKPKNASNLDIV